MSAKTHISIMERDKYLRGLKALVGPLRRFAVRHTRRPPIGKVGSQDLWRRQPISNNWGFDRGLPIDRYYIEQFLSKYACDIRGRVLEVADDEYTRRFGGNRVTKSDVITDRPGNPKATIIADLASAQNVQSEIFDCIICTQTLQLVYDVQSAVDTLFRSLKSDGTLLITVPGISAIARSEMEVRGDYWRFTTASLRRLFDSWPHAQIEVASCGNVMTAIAFLHGLAISEVSKGDLDYQDANYQAVVTARVKRVAR